MNWLTGEVFDVHTKLKTYSDYFMRQVPITIKRDEAYFYLYNVLAESCYHQSESIAELFYDLA